MSALVSNISTAFHKILTLGCVTEGCSSVETGLLATIASACSDTVTNTVPTCRGLGGKQYVFHIADASECVSFANALTLGLRAVSASGVPALSCTDGILIVDSSCATLETLMTLAARNPTVKDSSYCSVASASTTVAGSVASDTSNSILVPVLAAVLSTLLLIIIIVVVVRRRRKEQKQHPGDISSTEVVPQDMLVADAPLQQPVEEDSEEEEENEESENESEDLDEDLDEKHEDYEEPPPPPARPSLANKMEGVRRILRDGRNNDVLTVMVQYNDMYD